MDGPREYMLSKISQRKKNTLSYIYIWNLKNKTHITKKRITDIENKLERRGSARQR